MSDILKLNKQSEKKKKYKKREPACRCFISHILEAKFIENGKFHSIFSNIYRVRTIGTIFEKEVISFSGNLMTRAEIMIEDDTGRIQAIDYNANVEKYDQLKKGDKVSLMGIIESLDGENTIKIEILRRIDDLKYILLRNYEVKLKLKNLKVENKPNFELL